MKPLSLNPSVFLSGCAAASVLACAITYYRDNVGPDGTRLYGYIAGHDIAHAIPIDTWTHVAFTARDALSGEPLTVENLEIPLSLSSLEWKLVWLQGSEVSILPAQEEPR